jgi:hypothetical protein
MSAWFLQTALLADWATSTLNDLDPNKRFALMVVAIGCATGVLCTLITFVSSTINSIHHRRVESEMKRDMIERGMSADEIAKVIEAAMPPEDACQRWIASWAKKKA